MRWREALSPEPMARIAIVAPEPALRGTLVAVADLGTVELDQIDSPADRPLAQRTGRTDPRAGEAELAGRAADAVCRDGVAALLGWTPAARLPELAGRLAKLGAAAAPLPRPSGVDPPTALRSGPVRQGLAPLVNTYAPVPYVDIDPTVPAALAYLVMFGAMFGDVGHGALLLAMALAIRAGRPRRLAWLKPYWLFGAGAGVAAMLFGAAYGECFGPTGLLPALWLSPLDDPVPLLVAGVGLGALLLAGAYALGTANRVREGGWALALYAPSGLAGALLFLAAAIGAGAWAAALSWGWYVAAGVALVALVLAYVGLLAGAGPGPAGVLQASIELFDMVIRLGANVVSFARLAAFGLTHAVLGWIVWDATTGLWHTGPVGAAGAVVVFVVGNAVAFALEALVAGVQALRLEYYELFSRVFQREGRPFRPWHVPLAAGSVPEEESWTPG